MTLDEFVNEVQNDYLTDKRIQQSWIEFCGQLADLDIDCVKHLIKNNDLDGFISMESEDAFGTEGMSL